MDKNSAILWLPKIVELGLPTPKTVMIPYDHFKIVSFIESEREEEYFNQIVSNISSACDEIKYPCFIRTDLASAKHGGPSSYLASSDKDIPRVLARTVEDNELKFWPFTKPEYFMVRKFLILDFSFRAFNGLPIAREWRLFSDGNKILCAHPYWPKESIKFNRKPPKYWEKQLSDHHAKPSCFGDLENMAVKATGKLGGSWSVDFAMSNIGKWWLIDMATADDSFHWPGCNKYKGK